MKKALLVLLLSLPINSSAVNNTPIDEATRAKKWLIYNIEHWYDGRRLPVEKSINMYTAQYLELKQDAIGREFDGLTENQFVKKWKNKYNLKFVTGNSVLVGQQDYGKILVKQCILKSKLPNSGYIFSVLIEDETKYPDVKGYLKHKRDIKVIPYSSSFIIDDILEYD